MLVHLIEVGLTLNCKNFSTVVLHPSFKKTNLQQESY